MILTNGWDRAARRHAVERFHLDWEEFEDRHELLLDGFETGEVSLSEYMQRTVFYRQRSYSREEFEDFMFAQSQPLADSLSILGQLAATKKYFIAALNNESREINDYRIEKFRLRQYFEAFFSSCYLGLRKPDGAIYQRALSIAHCDPGECVFIDDRGLNLECAHELGMRTIQFNNTAQLQQDLARYGAAPDGK